MLKLEPRRNGLPLTSSPDVRDVVREFLVGKTNVERARCLHQRKDSSHLYTRADVGSQAPRQPVGTSARDGTAQPAGNTASTVARLHSLLSARPLPRSFSSAQSTIANLPPGTMVAGRGPWRMQCACKPLRHQERSTSRGKHACLDDKLGLTLISPEESGVANRISC